MQRLFTGEHQDILIETTKKNLRNIFGITLDDALPDNMVKMAYKALTLHTAVCDAAKAKQATKPAIADNSADAKSDTVTPTAITAVTESATDKKAETKSTDDKFKESRHLLTLLAEGKENENAASNDQLKQPWANFFLAESYLYACAEDLSLSNVDNAFKHLTNLASFLLEPDKNNLQFFTWDTIYCFLHTMTMKTASLFMPQEKYFVEHILSLDPKMRAQFIESKKFIDIAINILKKFCAQENLLATDEMEALTMLVRFLKTDEDEDRNDFDPSDEDEDENDTEHNLLAQYENRLAELQRNKPGLHR